MSEANKAVARKFLEALGRGDVRQIQSLITPDVQAICTGTSQMSGSRGYAEVCAAAGMLAQITKSGLELRVLNLTAEDDRVAAEIEGYSTLVNGVAYNNQYHFLLFIREGKIFRIREYLDTLLMERTLVPFLAQSA